MNTKLTSKIPFTIWILLSGLYITQRLGLGFIWISGVAILRSLGLPMAYLGGVYLLGIFWVLKFLWAPLVDSLGTYRDWILITQSGMVLTLITMGFMDVSRHFYIVFCLCALLAFLSATQDIATDGLALRLLLPEARGMGNGIQTAGGLFGYLIGGGVVLIAYPRIGWQGCMSLLAVCTAGSLVTVFLFQSTAMAIPSCNRTGGVTLRRCLRFWQTPGHGNWLVMLSLYPLGSGLGYALMTPWLVDTGWSMDRVAMLMSIAGSLIGVLTSLATGWLINRTGRRPVMIGTCIGQLAGLAALLAPMSAWVHDTGTCIAYGLFFISLSPITVILSTLMMDYASQESPATDYALQFGLFSLMMVAISALGTALAGFIGYQRVVMLALAISMLALVKLLRFAPLKNKKDIVSPQRHKEKKENAV